MLKKFQKEVLVILFIMITFYPAFRLYMANKNKIEKVLKGTRKISRTIVKSLEKDSIRQTAIRDTFRFNLNEVSWEALTLIPGIGEHTARKIVMYRLRNGKFKRVEDILKIKGIGSETLKKIKPYVYVK